MYFPRGYAILNWIKAALCAPWKDGLYYGLFDKLFGGKAASETKFSGQKMTVMLPIDGKVIPLEQLPDETFASAILGPGCGVEPTGDTVYAPLTAPLRRCPKACTPLV